MDSLSWEEFRANPRLLLDRLKIGRPLTLIHEGHSIAEVYPVARPGQEQARRPSGLAGGEFVVPDDFDDPLPDDILAAFEGGGPDRPESTP